VTWKTKAKGHKKMKTLLLSVTLIAGLIGTASAQQLQQHPHRPPPPPIRSMPPPHTTMPGPSRPPHYSLQPQHHVPPHVTHNFGGVVQHLGGGVHGMHWGAHGHWDGSIWIADPDDPRYYESYDVPAEADEALSPPEDKDTTEAPAGGSFGALAVGECDRHGYAWGQPSSDIAQARALAGCGNSATCNVVITVNHACAAFAVSGDCSARGWAYADSRAQAERLALSSCARYGGYDCGIRRWLCSGAANP
jgi:hypothetical protein